MLLTLDTDEIPEVDLMHALTNCQLLDSFKQLILECDFYYYSYECRN
jgi:hypothetical protein